MFKQNDIVEIKRNPFYANLVNYQGTVKQVLDFGQCLLTLIPVTDEISKKPTLYSTDWLVPSKYLELLESERDSVVNELELKIIDLEDSLLLARSILVVSEELREKQFNEIEKLKSEVTFLKLKLFDDFK